MTLLRQLGSEADPCQLYLRQLDAMREEMSSAMLAISGNSLAVFEDSLWRQEVLCLSLTRLLQSIQGTSVDSDALTSIEAATSALKRVNASYSELVHQSRTSAELLYTLCRSYTDSMVRDVQESSSNRCSYEA